MTPDYRLLPEATIDELLSDVQDAWKLSVNFKLDLRPHLTLLLHPQCSYQIKCPPSRSWLACCRPCVSFRSRCQCRSVIPHNPRLSPRLRLLFLISPGGYLALQGGHLFTPRPKAVASLYGYGCCDAKFFGTSKPPETLLGGLPLSNVLEHSRELEALLDVKGRPQIAGFPFNPGWGLREMLYLYLVGTGRCESIDSLVRVFLTAVPF